MIQNGQNSINRVALNFNYSSKDAAVRNNKLIETIFNSNILPELNKAITKEIPNEVKLELSKLEIDIGIINEKDLQNNLAVRLGEALAKALHIYENNINRPMNNENDNLSNDFAKDEETEFEIRISNAGIILFWPFLTRFFEQLSLLNNAAFMDDESRNEAVFLLQYLAYNSVDFPEHQLVLNKVLVGMLPHETLLPLPPLSEETKNMSTSLLNGLISNWEKLKDSSPEAMQETFLQREGLLSIEEEKVVLKIGKRGVDVLLTSIPWNIALIKLPWMKKPMYVEWV